VQTGASPRGLIKLIRAVHVEALLNGHTHLISRAADFDGQEEVVIPQWEDVRGDLVDDEASLACDVLRHRIRLAPSSLAAGQRPEDLIGKLCQWLSPHENNGF
jgi:hypothetical protein